MTLKVNRNMHAQLKSVRARAAALAGTNYTPYDNSASSSMIGWPSYPTKSKRQKAKSKAQKLARKKNRKK